MAGVAALADIDVAAGQFERRVDAHVRRVFHGLVDREQRRDLDDAADAGDADDGEHEPDGLAFKPVMKPEHVSYSPACNAGAPASTGRSAAGSGAARGAVRIVIQML